MSAPFALGQLTKPMAQRLVVVGSSILSDASTPATLTGSELRRSLGRPTLAIATAVADDAASQTVPVAAQTLLAAAVDLTVSVEEPVMAASTATATATRHSHHSTVTVR